MTRDHEGKVDAGIVGTKNGPIVRIAEKALCFGCRRPSSRRLIDSDRRARATPPQWGKLGVPG